jgi:hypothetical protein
MSGRKRTNQNPKISGLVGVAPVKPSVRARGADGHLGIDKGLAGVCPAISVVTAT